MKLNGERLLLSTVSWLKQRGLVEVRTNDSRRQSFEWKSILGKWMLWRNRADALVSLQGSLADRLKQGLLDFEIWGYHRLYAVPLIRTSQRRKALNLDRLRDQRVSKLLPLTKLRGVLVGLVHLLDTWDFRQYSLRNTFHTWLFVSSRRRWFWTTLLVEQLRQSRFFNGFVAITNFLQPFQLWQS